MREREEERVAAVGSPQRPSGFNHGDYFFHQPAGEDELHHALKIIFDSGRIHYKCLVCQLEWESQETAKPLKAAVP